MTSRITFEELSGASELPMIIRMTTTTPGRSNAMTIGYGISSNAAGPDHRHGSRRSSLDGAWLARRRESLPVPPHKRLWSHHYEKLSPVDHPREHDEGDARGIVQAPRLDPPLDIERQLLAQEQVLSSKAHLR
jgi:hypothetical protein